MDAGLDKIQMEAKELFKQHIKNNMIEYLRDINNDSSYKFWLYQFNEEEYDFEYNSKVRTNKYYHDIWNELNVYNDFTLIY